MNLSYEPVTMPRYQYEALTKRCAQLEEQNIALEKVSGLTMEQLARLFLRGYILCPSSSLSIPKIVEANTIKELLECYPITPQHVAALGNFCAHTAMNPGQLQDFLWRQLFLWQIGVHGPDILKRT